MQLVFVWPCVAALLGLCAPSDCILVEKGGSKRTLGGTLVHWPRISI